MPKYISVKGTFEQNGETAPTNNYKGYFEVEDETYMLQSDMGELAIQYFVGGQQDGYDRAKLVRPSMGGIQRLKNGTGSIFFLKLVNKDEMAAVNYGFNIERDGWEGKPLDGEWCPMDMGRELFQHGGKAVATFDEVTKENEEEFGKAQEMVELSKNMLAREDYFPLQMEYEKRSFEKNQENIKQIAKVGVLDKETGKYTIPSESKLGKMDERFHADKDKDAEKNNILDDDDDQILF
jgi:hypothetical protein